MKRISLLPVAVLFLLPFVGGCDDSEIPDQPVADQPSGVDPGDALETKLSESVVYPQ